MALRKPPKKTTNISKPNPRFVQVFSDEPDSKFKEIGTMVANKELKWVYFAMEGDRGCHYYQRIKKKK